MENNNAEDVHELSLEVLLALKERIDHEIESRNRPLPVDLPLSIFRSENLAPLETAVKYLKENCSLSYTQIAQLLHRSIVCIGLTYRNALRKDPTPIKEVTGIAVPLSTLQLNRLSLLESIVLHLKNQQFSLHTIAVLLGRDDRTVWTCVKRAEVKTHG